MFQQPAGKNADVKTDLWKRHGFVQSFQQGVGPTGLSLLRWFVDSRQISTCMPHDAWHENCSNFFSKDKNTKLQRAITAFSV